MFSKPWKPKKAHSITVPLITPDEPAKRATKEQKDKLMAQVPKGKTDDKTSPSGQVTAMQKVEMEKAKQDDALDDLSNILGDLKGMAVDMGGELDKFDGGHSELVSPLNAEEALEYLNNLIILSQEKDIQKLNELVRSLREQLSECRSNNGSTNSSLNNLTETILELERQQFLED